MEEIPIIKDITFWHLLSTASVGIIIKLATILIGLARDYMAKTEQTFKNITELLNSVVTKNETQEVKLDQHEKRIERLEGRL